MIELAREITAFLLIAVWFAALCSSVERRAAGPQQGDGWTKIKVHYG